MLPGHCTVLFTGGHCMLASNQVKEQDMKTNLLDV